MLENKEHNLHRKWKQELKKVLPDNVKTMVTYQSKKLPSKFPVKDKIDFQHQNNDYIMGNVQTPAVKMITKMKLTEE